MSYENPLLEVLTWQECNRFYDKDPEGFQNWVRRMNEVDRHFLDTGKKLPRHRYTKDPQKP